MVEHGFFTGRGSSVDGRVFLVQRSAVTRASTACELAGEVLSQVPFRGIVGTLRHVRCCYTFSTSDSSTCLLPDFRVEEQ